jgi:integrase
LAITETELRLIAAAAITGRRKRRALTEDELKKLLAVAATRPLADTRTIRRGKRRGEPIAELKPETIIRLQAVGRERALIYKMLVLTGLRKNELATLTVGQLDLAPGASFLQLDAADEKSREGNAVAIRDDLAADLRSWLDDKLMVLQTAARGTGEPIPMRLPADALLFDVPTGLLRILDRDLEAAGIPKRDDRGRTVDVHAMRTTFGTLLSKTGTAPRTAQAAMRHSDLKLTMPE